MPTTHAVVELPDTNGMPEDTVINTFTFDSEHATPQLAATAISLLLQSFYNTNGTFGVLASLLSRTRVRTALGCLMSFYDITADLSGTPAGSPVLVVPFTLAAAAVSTELPSECAVVGSFHSDLTDVAEETGATRPANRRRERLCT